VSILLNTCRKSNGTIAVSDMLPYFEVMNGRFLSQEEVTPALSLATDQFLVSAIQETGTPVLRIYSFPGDVVLLGRYHAVGMQPQTEETIVMRRLSGGRVMPGGQGFVQFSLILPHRSALCSDDPYHLAPFQVLNRYVRGVLQGLRAGGVSAFYPGRDLITARQQPLGWISFTTEESGLLLCEGGLAVHRDFSLLPYLLDRVDPQGSIPSQFFTAEQVLSVERLTAKAFTFSQVAGLICQGFTQQFALEFTHQDLNRSEQEEITTLAERQFSDTGLLSRLPRPDLPFQATTSTQLGVLQVRFALTPEKTLADIQFSGDFIADPLTLSRLERALRGCPLEQEALWQVVDRIFLQPQSYLLGIGPLQTIPETILRGSTAAANV